VNATQYVNTTEVTDIGRVCTGPCGELLEDVDRAGRGRPEKMLDDQTFSPPPTLSDLGITPGRDVPQDGEGI
jgi:hypothetical protein